MSRISKSVLEKGSPRAEIQKPSSRRHSGSQDFGNAFSRTVLAARKFKKPPRERISAFGISEERPREGFGSRRASKSVLGKGFQLGGLRNVFPRWLYGASASPRARARDMGRRRRLDDLRQGPFSPHHGRFVRNANDKTRVPTKTLALRRLGGPPKVVVYSG